MMCMRIHMVRVGVGSHCHDSGTWGAEDKTVGVKSEGGTSRSASVGSEGDEDSNVGDPPN